jgi:hypothetical protein
MKGGGNSPRPAGRGRPRFERIIEHDFSAMPSGKGNAGSDGAGRWSIGRQLFGAWRDVMQS